MANAIKIELTVNGAYLGNSNLKRAGQQIQFTPEMVQEWVKCSQDPIYFITSYYKIVVSDNDDGMMLFDPYPYQINLISSIIERRHTIAKVPRQTGKTTAVASAILYLILFRKNYQVAIVAHKHSQAREILSRIQKAYELLPKWLQQGIVVWNKGTIKLENGSSIETGATNGGTIRGKTFNMVYMDELAHVHNNVAREFFASTYPTITSGKKSKLVITSTPKGLNMFYELWMKSVKGKNDYNRIDVSWRDIPGRDEAWKEETIRNTSVAQFNEEFECSFIGSSETLISGAKLESLLALTEDPMLTSGSLQIFEMPIRDNIYAITVDVARGVGGDYSVFSVFNVTTTPYKLVAIFRDNLVDPMALPGFIRTTAIQYNRAHVLIETNDIGQQVADILHYDFEYENILMATNSGNRGQQVSAGFGGKLHYGVRTTKVVKKLGCSTLKTIVEKDQLLITSADAVEELTHFTLDGDSYKADAGHDDICMTLVLFGWLVDQPLMKEITDSNIRSRIQEMNASRIEDEILPVVAGRGYLDDIIPDGMFIDESDDSFSKGGWMVDNNWSIRNLF